MQIGTFSKLALFLGISLTLACNKTQLNEAKDKSKQQSTDAKTDKPDEDEKVDPPSNIAGSFLTCAIERYPSDQKPETLSGCRFEDNTGKKQALNQVAQQVDFGYRAPEDKQLVVQVKKLANDVRYDVMYLVIGADKDRAMLGMQNLKVRAKLQGVVNANIERATVGGTVLAVGKDPGALPEARTTDYDAIRDQMINEYQSGQVTPPL